MVLLERLESVTRNVLSVAVSCFALLLFSSDQFFLLLNLNIDKLLLQYLVLHHRIVDFIFFLERHKFVSCFLECLEFLHSCNV